MIGHIHTTYDCTRNDLKRPVMIFGGLLLTATVFCGAMEASSGTPGVVAVEEVQVLRDEQVIEPYETDPVAMSCDSDDSDKKTRAGKCRERAQGRL